MVLIGLMFLLAGEAAPVPALEFRIPPETPQESVIRQVVDHGRWRIYASGDIGPGDGDALRRYAAEHGIDWAIVYFDSPGGSLVGGLKVGETLRQLKFDTGIGRMGDDGRHRYEGVCASACAYAFAGGLNRYFSGGDQRLGIHQFYAQGDNTGDLGDAQLLSGLLVSYLERMGVRATAFSVASVTPGSDMTWLSKEQATTLGLANNGMQPPTAEIRMAGQHPYLKLEQSFAEVTSRVLLSCDASGLVSVAGGIVTTPELSADKQANLGRTYLEFDDLQVQPRNGSGAASASGSVLWVRRDLTGSELVALLNADRIGMWTENGGPMRWGASLELVPVRDKVVEFVRNCAGR